ncbi:MAG: ferredoxin, partial [Actinomycetota bacterium]
RILLLNPIACDGHGLCADALPEMISLDEWGYPIVSREAIPAELMAAARQACVLCPKLAISITHEP